MSAGAPDNNSNTLRRWFAGGAGTAPNEQRDISTPPGRRDRLEEYGPLLLLVVLGLLWSLHFWRHFVFPNSDYFSFVTTGRQWLSFHLPTSMKRGPVFSVLAGLLSMIFPQPQVQLAATELYNALLLPGSMVLFYLVGREMLGRRAALVAALLAGISPWMIRMSSEALVEMTLVALFAGSVLCAARGRLGGAYALAVLAALARWDMAGLIPAVALADLAQNRRFLRTLVRTGLACAPFALCLALTAMQLAGQDRGIHYLQVMAEERSFGLGEDLHSYWEVILASVSAPPSRKTAGGFLVLHGATPALFWLTALPLGLMFLWGSWRGLVQRRSEVLVLLATGVPYVLVHAVYPYRLARFCVPMAWAGLMIALYGAGCVLTFLQDRWALWRHVKPVLQAGAVVVLLVWTAGVARTLQLGVARKVCPGIERVVCWSAAIAVAGYLGWEWLAAVRRRCAETPERTGGGVSRQRRSAGAPRSIKRIPAGVPVWREVCTHPGRLAVAAFLLLAIVSSGTQTAALMEDGKALQNFKLLSLWFRENGQPGDRMVTNMPYYMPLYTGLPADRFVHTGSIPLETAPDFPRFIEACRARGVTLIAWDSGLANNTRDRYYKLWGLDRVSPLGAGFTGHRKNQIESCRLVHVIPEGYPQIAVWRIGPESRRSEKEFLANPRPGVVE